MIKEKIITKLLNNLLGKTNLGDFIENPQDHKVEITFDGDRATNISIRSRYEMRKDLEKIITEMMKETSDGKYKELLSEMYEKVDAITRTY